MYLTLSLPNHLLCGCYFHLKAVSKRSYETWNVHLHNFTSLQNGPEVGINAFNILLAAQKLHIVYFATDLTRRPKGRERVKMSPGEKVLCQLVQGLTEVSWHPSVCRHLSLNDSSSQRKWVNSLTETEKSKEGCVSSVCADWIITVCHSNLSNMLITLSGQTLGHRPTPCTRRSWTLNRRTASHVQFCFHRQNQKCLVQEMLFSRMFGTVKLDGCYWDIHRAFWINVTCYKNQ